MNATNKRQFANLIVFGIALGLNLSHTLSAQTWNVVTSATASDVSASSYYGSSVVMEGDYAVSRAAGSIYILKRDVNTGVWAQKQKISLTGSYNYGNGSISLSGDYIAAIGGSSQSTGSLYIFKRDPNTNTWAQQQILHPSDATGFTGAVSVSGNYIVAGATAETEDVSGSNPLTNAGAAYIYEKTGGTWSEQQKIVADSRISKHYFGSSVSIYGDYIVIGASGYHTYTSQTDYVAGTAYAFKRDANADIWIKQGSVFTGSAPSGSNTANTLVGSVNISKDYLVVGAYKNYYGYYSGYNNYNYYSAAVSIYTQNSANSWILKQTLPIDNLNNTTYGSSNYIPSYLNSVSITGNYLSLNYSDIGSYLYRKNSTGTWTQLQSFGSGTSVSVSGDDVAIGNSSINSNAGGVSFYRRSPYATLLRSATSIGSVQDSKASASLIYNTPFTASPNQTWLSVTPSGVTPVNISDTIPLVFTASVNTTTSPRIAKVTVAATGVSNQYVIVTQKAVSVITWSSPADMVYGSAISKVQLNATANVEGTFTYTPTLETVMNVGSAQSLQVSFMPKDTANYEPASKTVQINVIKATPVINWSIPADIPLGTALNDNQLNATSSVVGTYTYNPAAGTKLALGSGQTLSVQFTPVDAANFESVSKTVLINVVKPLAVITWDNPKDMTYGTALSATQLNATANVPGTFTYKPSIDAILNVGIAQSLQVTFTPTDAVNYQTTTKTVQINVNKKVPVITWDNPADIIYGTTLSATHLNATADVSGTFTYNPVIGTKLALGPSQTLSVQFTPTDVANIESASKTVKINVVKPSAVITWANPTDLTYGTALSATQLNAIANIPGTFTYKPSIGVILNAGAAQLLQVTFAPTDAANYQTTIKTVQINVNKKVPVITWNSPADIVYGTTLSATQLNATADVTGAFTYNPVIGTKLALGAGQTLSVQFTPIDIANFESISKTVKVNVVKPTAIITWVNPTDITYGTALSAIQLNATANVSGNFTYSPSIGAVLNAGVAQSLQVTFTPTDIANYQTTTKTVQINVNKKVPVITWDNPADIIYGTTLSTTQLNATADVSGTFTYNPVAGTKLALGSGQTLLVLFTPTDVGNFELVSKTVKINVVKSTAVITWTNPADITYGTALSATQLNAIANVPGTFTYKPSIGTVLNAGVAQSLQVTFTPTDIVNYVSASKLVQINIKKKVPAVTWNNPVDIIYGTTLSAAQLNATADVLGTFIYSPVIGTKLAPGSGQTLSVQFTPVDAVNLESASKNVQINVKKATPVITWTNPTDMFYGDALSSTQLNATANVPGTFTYNPSVGTKLNAGNGQTLLAQFKASDEINYELVSKQVSVNVIQPVLSVSANTVNISFTGRETSTLTINSNSPWVVTSDQTWLTVSPSSGTGNGTIMLSVSENITAFDRKVTITIKGSGGTSKIITVTQIKVLQIIANISRKWNDVLVCNNSAKLFIDYQWYKNDAPITGENKQYYQTLGVLDGSYYVKVTTSDGISGISNTIDVNKASKSIKSIKVYPNPTENNQNFSLEIKATKSELKQAELTILSSSGQIILQNSNLQQQMQLNGLSRGCYIIHIRLASGELLNEKLMVN